MMILPIGLMGSSRKESSFSLIEILLVMILLAVIAGMSVPQFGRSYANMQLEQAAENLAYTMRYAQSRAVVKSRKMRLEFDSSFSSYWLTQEVGRPRESQAGALSAEGGAFERFSGRSGRTFSIPDKYQVEFDERIVYFYPDGTIDKQQINICSEKKCLTVSTKEQRGYVRILGNQ